PPPAPPGEARARGSRARGGPPAAAVHGEPPPEDPGPPGLGDEPRPRRREPLPHGGPRGPGAAALGPDPRRVGALGHAAPGPAAPPPPPARARPGRRSLLRGRGRPMGQAARRALRLRVHARGPPGPAPVRLGGGRSGMRDRPAYRGPRAPRRAGHRRRPV